MVEIVSRGTAEITIMDLTDSKRYTGYIIATDVRQVIFNPDDNTYKPDYSKTPIILAPQLKREGSGDNIIAQCKSVKWYFQHNSVSEPREIQANAYPGYFEILGNYMLKILYNPLKDSFSQKYYCEMTYVNENNEEVTILTDFEIIKIFSSSSAKDSVVGYLTNDSDLIPTDIEGLNGDYSEIKTEMKVYEGTNDVTTSWNINIKVSNGVIGRKIGHSGYKIDDLNSDKGIVTFTATKTGDSRSIVRHYSVTKVKNSDSQELYKISPSVSVIRKNKNDEYEPRSIVIDAYKKKGREPLDKYLGYIRILYSKTYDGDPSSYTEAYKSSTSENKKEYSIPENISAVRVELYSDKTMKNLLDFQNIPVVLESKITATAIITTPNGTVIRNNKGELKAVLTMYKGSDLVTADTYRWYILNPQATGDIYSGTGWTNVNTLEESQGIKFNNAELTVKANGINGNETFMCIAELDGLKYKVTVTFTDLQDEYIVNVIGSGIFKNGKGTNTYVCKVYSRGNEIDLNGDKYKYTWTMYNPSGHLMTFNKTGKRINVSSDEITNKAVLTCTVEEK